MNLIVINKPIIVLKLKIQVNQTHVICVSHLFHQVRKDLKYTILKKNVKRMKEFIDYYIIIYLNILIKFYNYLLYGS